jgi:PadR family transcriptional regulator PadR
MNKLRGQLAPNVMDDGLRLTYIAVPCTIHSTAMYASFGKQRMSQSKELVAASATSMVLAIVSRGETYGYAIIKEIHKVSDAQIEWTDGMLYPVLRRLEKQGLLKSQWRVAESGKRRRYYAIKKTGRQALAAYRQQWQMTNRVLNSLWKRAECLT